MRISYNKLWKMLIDKNIMATIMYMDVSLVATEAAVAWINGGRSCSVEKRRHRHLFMMSPRR